jgi:hypothetical protein
MNQNLVKHLFEYKDGSLYWKNSIRPGWNGKKAGRLNEGYNYIKIDGKLYGEHRLIFLMFHGYLPIEVDHIKGLNNHIENLRAADRSGNCRNTRIPCTNTSGIKGVSWHKHKKKWSVQLSVNNKPRHFGDYYDIDYAKFVIEAIRNKYHKEFANHG